MLLGKWIWRSSGGGGNGRLFEQHDLELDLYIASGMGFLYICRFLHHTEDIPLHFSGQSAIHSNSQPQCTSDDHLPSNELFSDWHFPLIRSTAHGRRV